MRSFTPLQTPPPDIESRIARYAEMYAPFNLFRSMPQAGVAPRAVLSDRGEKWRNCREAADALGCNEVSVRAACGSGRPLKGRILKWGRASKANRSPIDA